MRPFALFLAVGIWISACVGCAGSLAGAAPPPLDPDVVAAEWRRTAVVEVSCLTEPGGGYGSAVLLDDDTAVTALHVVAPGRCPGGALYEIVLRDGTRYMVGVARSLPDADLARLEAVLPWPSPGGPLATAPPPATGEQTCRVSAWPIFMRFCGEVQEFDKDFTSPGSNIFFDSVVHPGNSGSPLYDTGGRLVGIVTNQVRCGGTPCGGTASRLHDRWAELMR